MATSRKPLPPALGSILFVLFIPGTVVGLVPWLLCHWEPGARWGNLAFLRWLGAALFLAGLPTLLEAVGRFVQQGRGTPAPWMPTEGLVVTGLYRHVRNPMYLGVLSMIVGQGLFFASIPVLCYAAVVACCFVLFVHLYEEPTLFRRYGEQYAIYCLNVPRWLPRWTPWNGK